MNTFELAAENILSPVVMCYFLGIFAKLARSDLKIPDPVYNLLTIYLLLSLGLKGGHEIAQFAFIDLLLPVIGTLILALITPLIAYKAARTGLRLGVVDSAALSAHYGSVSVVTFITALTFLQNRNESVEPYMTALVVIMEVPAIVLALTIGKRALKASNREGSESSEPSSSIGTALFEIMTSKSILLLLGGLVIGALSSESSFLKVKPFFFDPFQGVVALFLLEMGILTATRLKELKAIGLRLVLFGILIPLINGLLGVTFATALGLNPGGATILGVLSASASYIAAPAAVRLALPEANPSLYLTASLGITFPFNLTLGIVLIYEIARGLEGVFN